MTSQITINYIDLDGDHGDMTCPCAIVLEWMNAHRELTVREAMARFVEAKGKMSILIVTSWTVRE